MDTRSTSSHGTPAPGAARGGRTEGGPGSGAGDRAGRPRVLVAYGSKRGGTRGIADEAADALRADGCTVTVLPAGRVGSVADYDAVLLGGALYMYRWHRDARRFARRHARALAGRPVWLFSSGPLDGSAEEREIPPVRGAERAARRLRARGHETFGGVLAADADGRIARSMVRRGLEGDHRDPEHIRAWAHAVAAQLAGTRRDAPG